MSMEKLREELAKLLFDWIDDDGWEWWEVDKDVRDHYRNKTDSILSLLAPVFEKAGKYEKAAKGLKAVEDLMNNSEGVMGLHLNGDIAPWSELRTEGRFEEWLVAFDEAISEVPDGN